MANPIAPIGMKQEIGSGEFVMSTSAKDTDAIGSKTISIALISPEEMRRKPLTDALAELRGSITREFASYPELDDVPRLLEADYDVIIVELDSNPEYALDLVESICANSSATVMVYSGRVYPDMLPPPPRAVHRRAFGRRCYISVRSYREVLN